MTDHQKLLVALLADSDTYSEDPVTAPAVTAILYEMGEASGRPSRAKPARLSA